MPLLLATDNLAVRGTLALGLMAWSPEGDVSAAEAIDGALAAAGAAGDEDRVIDLEPLAQVAYVLRARAR